MMQKILSLSLTVTLVGVMTAIPSAVEAQDGNFYYYSPWAPYYYGYYSDPAVGITKSGEGSTKGEYRVTIEPAFTKSVVISDPGETTAKGIGPIVDAFRLMMALQGVQVTTDDVPAAPPASSNDKMVEVLERLNTQTTKLSDVINDLNQSVKDLKTEVQNLNRSTPDTSDSTQQTGTNKGIALCVGLDSVDSSHYRGWNGALPCCEKDAKDFEAIAVKQGFDSKRFLTRNATRTSVKSAILDAARKLNAGDIFLFYYSGHGGLTPDKNGDENQQTAAKLNGVVMDTTMCLFDGHLVDDELGNLWTEFKRDVRIVVISDSCHSGTITKVAPYLAYGPTGVPDGIVNSKGLYIKNNEDAPLPKNKSGNSIPVTESPIFKTIFSTETFAKEENVAEYTGPKYKLMPIGSGQEIPFPLAVYQMHKAEYDRIQTDNDPNKNSNQIEATVLLIAACQDQQLSLAAQDNSVFTRGLKAVWSNGAFSGNYNTFRDSIETAVGLSSQIPNLDLQPKSPSNDFRREKPFTINP